MKHKIMPVAMTDAQRAAADLYNPCINPEGQCYGDEDFYTAMLNAAPEVDEEMVERVRLAFQNWYILGTIVEGKIGYHNPWFVVDGSSAEPDVNYPGDLVAGPFETLEEAETARAQAVIKAIQE